eukprot:2638162-Prymnesium_polylepis.1
MARTAAAHLSGRPRMSPRLADEQVGPQRSKVRALLNSPLRTRMRRVERRPLRATEIYLGILAPGELAGRAASSCETAILGPRGPRGNVRLPP